MNNSAQNQYHSLMEAYYAVYDEDIRNKLNEEKEIKEFLEVIDFLIEDGYDLSEYTYEELYEFHITEGWGALLKGAAQGIGTLLKKSGGKIYQGAKEPAKKVLTKLGKAAVPAAIAAGLDQYLTGGKGREYAGATVKGIRQLGHSIPSPGQAADSFKAPETAKPSPARRNLPPSHLTQGYSYGKNNIITEDPAFPSQKPKGGDWSKLTIGGTTKLWDPETNSYQLPGTINKRLKSQGEKEITVPGKAPKPTPAPAPEAPKPTPSPAPASEAPKPPASSPRPSTPSAAPAPSRSSSSATASTADKIKSGMDVYNKQRSSGDFKSATETGKSVWALANPKLAAAAAERARTRGTSATTNPQMDGLKSRLPAPAAPKVAPNNTLSNAVAAASKPAAFNPAPEVKATNKIAATPKPTPVTPKQQRLNMEMEYDAYDLVLEYLLAEGHADTVEEANYVMLEMDAGMVQDIVETCLDEAVKGAQRSIANRITGNDIRKVTRGNKDVYKKPKSNDDIENKVSGESQLRRRGETENMNDRRDRERIEANKKSIQRLNAKPGEDDGDYDTGYYGDDDTSGGKRHYSLSRTNRDARRRRESGR